jgi:choline dehydrogenase-like flavoprotein
MGRLGDENACVAADFCVFGMQKLRVVDLAVMPLLVSNHTASTAYLIGETAAEKIICAYDLDSTPCV